MELSPWARAQQSPHMAAAVHWAASWKPWHRVQSRTSGRLTTILAGLDPKTRKGEGVALGRTTVKPLGILPGTTRGAKAHDFGRDLIDSGGVRAASRPHESALAGGPRFSHGALSANNGVGVDPPQNCVRSSAVGSFCSLLYFYSLFNSLSALLRIYHGTMASSWG